MRNTILTLISAAISFSCKMDLDRLSIAKGEKQVLVNAYLKDKNINADDYQLLLLAIKQEKLLQVYAKNPTAQDYHKIVEYPFAANSGGLGPKIKEGDKQIPEGFYIIDRFNERSRFYLSLGLDYPTEADLEFADPKTPGKDIFIHGGNSSVGCIAITDDKIKELYLLAKFSHQPIQVIILPFADKAAIKKYENLFPQWNEFWTGLYNRYEKLDLSLKN